MEAAPPSSAEDADEPPSLAFGEPCFARMREFSRLIVVRSTTVAEGETRGARHEVAGGGANEGEAKSPSAIRGTRIVLGDLAFGVAVLGDLGRARSVRFGARGRLRA